MTQAVTVARELLADGSPITLADGTVVRLRYTFRGLAALEAEFGSLRNAEREMREAFPTTATTGPARSYTVLLRALATGLTHEKRPLGSPPMTVRLSDPAFRDDLLGEMLDPTRVAEYLTAWGNAVRDAFGALYGDADPHQAQGKTTDSPGPSGTEPSSSASNAATASSGA